MKIKANMNATAIDSTVSRNESKLLSDSTGVVFSAEAGIVSSIEIKARLTREGKISGCIMTEIEKTQ